MRCWLDTMGVMVTVADLKHLRFSARRLHRPSASSAESLRRTLRRNLGVDSGKRAANPSTPDLSPCFLNADSSQVAPDPEYQEAESFEPDPTVGTGELR